jgi:murein L,D-transpeptidase YafK
VPAPTPAPAPVKQESEDSAAERDVASAVRNWAEAWSRKDMGDYFAAYAKDFDGGKSRKAWEQERRERITGKRSISVKISGLKVSVNGNKATAQFRQEYKADSLSVSSGKRLDLVRSGGNWVIVKESTGS